MQPDSPIYKKAFQNYLRYGIPLEVQLKAAEGHATTHYIWRTQGDGKVRASHVANDGKIFAWADTPATGHPGEDFGCRCWAEPYGEPIKPGIYDPPLEPVYPELALLSLLPAGRVLSALRSLRRMPTYKPALRQDYERAVRNLEHLERALRSQGASPEKIARALSGARRQLGEAYKERTPEPLRKKIFDRNMAKYGDEFGPTPEYLRSRGKTWEEIIESAKRPGGDDLFK